jgi:hypothetical protein
MKMNTAAAHSLFSQIGRGLARIWADRRSERAHQVALKQAAAKAQQELRRSQEEKLRKARDEYWANLSRRFDRWCADALKAKAAGFPLPEPDFALRNHGFFGQNWDTLKTAAERQILYGQVLFRAAERGELL